MAAERKPEVLILQHVAPERPGLLATILAEAGWPTCLLRPFRGERVPKRMAPYAGLVLMGGPMSAYNTEGHPHLHKEIALIQDALQRGRPVLGICLGSQLLAAAVGAAVYPGLRREIGWHEVHLTQAAAADPLFSRLPARFTAFHWHGDVFALPRGAVSLAWSHLTECQAFRYGPNAYGLLFHLEVDEAAVRRMVRHFAEEMLSTGQRAKDILEVSARQLPELKRIGQEVFTRWVRLLDPKDAAGTSPHSKQPGRGADATRAGGHEDEPKSDAPGRRLLDRMKRSTAKRRHAA